MKKLLTLAATFAMMTSSAMACSLTEYGASLSEFEAIIAKIGEMYPADSKPIRGIVRMYTENEYYVTNDDTISIYVIEWTDDTPNDEFPCSTPHAILKQTVYQ